jgi:glycosyltransferase involved in cell wall biosynthesis
MISVLRSWKGHPVFFKAVRILKNSGARARFVVVGGGAPVERFQQLARDEGVDDCVTFTGHREDVPEILRALAVLVIPSTKHEGIPQIGLQALATKTPVVGSDAGGIPEIIRHGETGRIFPAGDTQALARAIRETLTATDATRAMTERGRAYVETHHSLDRMLQMIEELYRRHLSA